MPIPHGKFIWCELMAGDAQAAERFYTEVIGWTATDSGLPGIQYTILSASSGGVGGIVALSPEALTAGAQPGWIGYIAATDVDQTVAALTSAGGTVHKGPADIPMVGRFAIASDPQGAAFAMLTPAGHEGAPPAPPGTPGTVGWRELHAADWPAAFDFYAGLFGWTKTMAVEMGPMGTYQTFAMQPDGDMAGGMMNKQEHLPRPVWFYYFTVDDINAAAGRVTAQGGHVVNGPMQVPGGSWIANCIDPQGIAFSLTAAQ